MSGMLCVVSRNVPRSIHKIKIIKQCLGESYILKGPLRQRAYHQSAKLLPNSYLLTSTTLLVDGRVCNVSCLSLVHSRLFRTSAVFLQEIKIVVVPPFPDSVTEGDIRFTKKVGDQVNIDEVIAEVETDKTAMPIHSPGSGIIEEILVQSGSTVRSGTNVFKLKITGVSKPAAATPSPAPSPPSPTGPAVRAPSSPPKAPAAPLPRAASPKPAAPPAAMPPKPAAAPMTSIPVAAIRHAQAIDAAVVKVPPQDPTKEIAGTRTQHRVKMNRMRLKIAERLKHAQNTAAMLTTFNEIDMSEIMDFRKDHQDAFQKKYGFKLGFMSAFTKASAYALQDQPAVNAVIDDATSEIIYRDYIDISVAVATPRGLVVPVIRNVESMNYADIEMALNALGDKARKGKLAIEDMDGGTFTISNGGVFGSLLGTPIINPPQSAILGMHGIFERPIAVNGQVVIRPMMYIALTYDHRLIDGREAVMFLRKIKAAVEDPRIILAGL